MINSRKRVKRYLPFLSSSSNWPGQPSTKKKQRKKLLARIKHSALSFPVGLLIPVMVVGMENTGASGRAGRQRHPWKRPIAPATFRPRVWWKTCVGHTGFDLPLPEEPGLASTADSDSKSTISGFELGTWSSWSSPCCPPGGGRHFSRGNCWPPFSLGRSSCPAGTLTGQPHGSGQGSTLLHNWASSQLRFHGRKQRFERH